MCVLPEYVSFTDEVKNNKNNEPVPIIIIIIIIITITTITITINPLARKNLSIV